MSSQLIWELVKNNNAFIVKGVNGSVFSKEAGNLYNKHTYKYSGLANLSKTVDVSAEGDAVTVSKSSSRKPGKFGKSLVKKNARRTAYAAGAEAKGLRPDLKAAAQARASAVHKGLRTKKAMAKSA